MTKFLIGKKKIISIALMIVAIVLSVVLLFKLGMFDKFSSAVASPSPQVQKENSAPSVFKQEIKPIYLPPNTVTFKEKTLDIEEVGVEEGGFLGVPSGWYTAGWYKDSAKAGEQGNIVLDGHYDTNTGAPGAFWELKDLQIGDKVLLTDALGRNFEYAVTQKSYIAITDPERAKVFDSTQAKELTLITCGGVLDYASGTYNKRLVIKAEFAKMEKNW